jgi:hypothetical protein
VKLLAGLQQEDVQYLAAAGHRGGEVVQVRLVTVSGDLAAVERQQQVEGYQHYMAGCH